MPYNITCNLFSPCILLNSAGIWKTNMWYNQGIFKEFLEYFWIFQYFCQKQFFTAWQACNDIRQVLQNNHGIPWPKTFQSFWLAEEKNKIIRRRKRVFLYFFNNFTTADVTSALASVDVVWIPPWLHNFFNLWKWWNNGIFEC